MKKKTHALTLVQQLRQIIEEAHGPLEDGETQEIRDTDLGEILDAVDQLTVVHPV